MAGNSPRAATQLASNNIFFFPFRGGGGAEKALWKVQLGLAEEKKEEEEEEPLAACGEIVLLMVAAAEEEIVLRRCSFHLRKKYVAHEIFMSLLLY